MPNHSTQLDRLFRALADATRRAIVAHLAQGPAAVSELAAPFDMALPSFLQHLEILEDCGLLRSRKVGRVRTCQLKPQNLKKVEGWLSQQQAMWERRFDSLDDYLITVHKKGRKP